MGNDQIVFKHKLVFYTKYLVDGYIGYNKNECIRVNMGYKINTISDNNNFSTSDSIVYKTFKDFMLFDRDNIYMHLITQEEYEWGLIK